MTRGRQSVSIDERGFVSVDGVKIGKRVVKDGVPRLQVADKDRRRSAERGTRLVEVSPEELAQVLDDTPLIGIADIEEDIPKGGQDDSVP